MMDDVVTRAKRRMQPAGIDPDYDVAYEHFDVMHFLLQAHGLQSSERIDPLRLFLRNGADAKASPEINFDMQSYLERHPERAKGSGRSPYVDWLTHGRAAGEIADPAPGVEKMAHVLGLEVGELVDELSSIRLDLQHRLRTGTLGEVFARAAEVEPLIGEVWAMTTNPNLPPLVWRDTVEQVAAMQSCQQQAGFATARLVLVISDPRWGGGRRMEGHIAHALTRHVEPEDIVVIYTDSGGAAPSGRFPAGVREVDLAGAVQGMKRNASHRMLIELIRSFRADAVVNINARLLYEALETYGKALLASERLYLVQFCNEQQAQGHWVGIPLRFFYRYFDLVDGVLTDSEYLASWLRERHQLGPETEARVQVLRAPVDPSIPVVLPEEQRDQRRPQIFWAGRWDRQKRVDLALEVARRMPDVDLRMWGEAVLSAGHVAEAPDNVRLEGAYGHLSDLDLSAADVWLYTSAWDGVPSQLLEVGMTTIPIVGSLVGGTGELLDETGAWPVRDVENPDAYVAAIREVLSDPAGARRRARDLRQRLLRERTEEAFSEHVSTLLLDGRREGRR
ncbi:MAG TPA: glycosyltransferase family 4 protein [Nocardioides sp.]|nr:glycosyltransferase family 4 protein [Nocardioides sp.]